MNEGEIIMHTVYCLRAACCSGQISIRSAQHYLKGSQTGFEYNFRPHIKTYTSPCIS